MPPDDTTQSASSPAAGVATCIVRPEPFDPARHLPAIAKAGFRSIELNSFRDRATFNWTSREAVAELAQIARDHGMQVASVHAGGRWPGLTHGAPEVARYHDLLKRFCDLAIEVEAGFLVVHLPNVECEGDIERMREWLTPLAEFLRPLPLRVGLENRMQRAEPAAELDLIASWAPDVFGFVLDTGHAHITGHLDAYLAAAGPRLIGLHLNDNNGGIDAHRFPGEGAIPWARFMRGVAASGFCGPLMLEVAILGDAGSFEERLARCTESVRMLTDLLNDSRRAARDAPPA